MDQNGGVRHAEYRPLELSNEHIYKTNAIQAFGEHNQIWSAQELTGILDVGATKSPACLSIEVNKNVMSGIM